jgi:hypothetical protein
MTCSALPPQAEKPTLGPDASADSTSWPVVAAAGVGGEGLGGEAAEVAPPVKPKRGRKKKAEAEGGVQVGGMALDVLPGRGFRGVLVLGFLPCAYHFGQMC